MWFKVSSVIQTLSTAHIRRKMSNLPISCYTIDNVLSQPRQLRLFYVYKHPSSLTKVYDSPPPLVKTRHRSYSFPSEDAKQQTLAILCEPFFVNVLSLRSSIFNCVFSAIASASAAIPGWCIPFCGIEICSNVPIAWNIIQQICSNVPIAVFSLRTDRRPNWPLQSNFWLVQLAAKEKIYCTFKAWVKLL